MRRHGVHPEDQKAEAEQKREWLNDLEARVMEQRKRKAELQEA